MNPDLQERLRESLRPLMHLQPPAARSASSDAPQVVRRRGVRLLRAAVVLAATAALVTGVIVAGRLIGSETRNGPAPPGFGPSCVAGPTHPPRPAVTATSGIVEYHVPGLGGIQRVISGPDGNLWFVGGSGGSPNGLVEVIGRITPSGGITLYHLSGNPGEAFDGITAGPDGNVWFTESTANAIGRLHPATGRIDVFPVPLPMPPPSAPPRNTQTTDIVAGPDGNLWFNVDQIADAPGKPNGYVGRITPSGEVSLFTVPGGGQPEGIQVGADGNLWSRIALSNANSTACGAIPGYTSSAEVVRVTPAGAVTQLGEDSPRFAGYSVGPDGNYWWLTSSGMMRRTTPAGQTTDFPAFTSLGFWDPAHIAFGPDRNIWYVDGSDIDRMTPTGKVTIYHARGSNSAATWITAGPDGRMWFVEGASGAATVGAIRPAAGWATEVVSRAW